MRRIILDTLRRVTGVAQLRRDVTGFRDNLTELSDAHRRGQREMTALRDDVAQLTAMVSHARDELRTAIAAMPTLPVLPGTPYSAVSVPMEYPPSRDMRPRWGNTQPIIQPIADWMRPHDQEYRSILAAISDKAPALSRIPLDFDPSLLPEPAWRGVPFAPIDSAALYTLIGETKPSLYLEIGSGITTAFARRSVLDHGLTTTIVSIDPEPRAAIDGICDEVIRAGLETCDLAVFDRLQPGDILFMDGSHRVFMNSDVTVFMLDVLPRLKPGVLVHVHDIQLPWDYPDMFTNWYWSEAYILAAYIIGAAARLRPVLPTAWVCRQPAFVDWFHNPPVDLGASNDGWLGGGSLWFTHRG